MITKKTIFTAIFLCVNPFANAGEPLEEIGAAEINAANNLLGLSSPTSIDRNEKQPKAPTKLMPQDIQRKKLLTVLASGSRTQKNMNQVEELMREINAKKQAKGQNISMTPALLRSMLLFGNGDSLLPRTDLPPEENFIPKEDRLLKELTGLGLCQHLQQTLQIRYENQNWVIWKKFPILAQHVDCWQQWIENSPPPQQDVKSTHTKRPNPEARIANTRGYKRKNCHD